MRLPTVAPDLDSGPPISGDSLEDDDEFVCSECQRPGNYYEDPKWTEVLHDSTGAPVLMDSKYSDALTCLECEQELDVASAPPASSGAGLRTSNPTPGASYGSSVGHQQADRSSRRGRIIAAVITALALMGGGIGLAFALHSNGNSQTASTEAPGSNPAPGENPTGETTAPSSLELQQAYQQGLSYAQTFISQGNSGFRPSCTGPYSNSELNAQYYDGCEVGLG
jgi:hypothetical protein